MEKKSNEVKMNASNAKQEKLTYEQLEKVANDLNNNCNMLYRQLQQAQNTIAEFNEIGMLLDVLKQAEQFSPDFIERCANKIEGLITAALDESEKQQKAQNQEKN